MKKLIKVMGWFVFLFFLSTIFISADEMPAKNPSANWISVISFGAKGDGKTDDIQAIQAAIDSRKDSGGVLYFPLGKYKVTQDIKIFINNVVLAGEGTILFEDDGKLDNRKILVTGKNVTIKDIKITSTATKRTGVYGLISCNGAKDVTLKNLEISDSPSTAIHSIDTKNLTIDGCHIHDTYADGIHLSRHTCNVVITNCIIEKTADDGIGLISYINDGKHLPNYPPNNNIIVANNIICDLVRGRGICNASTNVSIIGNTIYNTNLAGIIQAPGDNIAYSSNTRIIGNTIYSIRATPESGAKSGIFLAYDKNTIVADNIIYDCPDGDGITLWATTKDTVIKNNSISRCARGITAVSYQFATFDSRMALFFEDYKKKPLEYKPEDIGIDNVIISGNLIQFSDRDGMYLQGTGQRYLKSVVITDNILFENNQGNYNDARDIFVSQADGLIIKDNYSRGTSASKGLSPAQGYNESKNVVFEPINLSKSTEPK